MMVARRRLAAIYPNLTINRPLALVIIARAAIYFDVNDLLRINVRRQIAAGLS